MPRLLFAGVLFCDQFTKYIVQSSMLPGESLPVIPRIFHLTYVLNAGAAFGLFEHARFFFIAVALLVCALFAVFHAWLLRESRLLYYGAVFLLAGTVGNLIDRIRMGRVIDFFDFRIWPVFNLADISIVAGVGLFIYALLFQKDREEQ